MAKNGLKGNPGGRTKSVIASIDWKPERLSESWG